MLTQNPVSSDLQRLYTPIIDGILSGADLQTISAKRIRAGLQDKVDHDISVDKVRPVVSWFVGGADSNRKP
jgi:upstream activation factor subunit UAF30